MIEVDVFNPVTKPKHYMLFPEHNIEVRDVIQRLVEKIEKDYSSPSGMFYADYVQAMQYIMRFMDKNGVEDLKKCRWYLNKMIEAMEHDA